MTTHPLAASTGKVHFLVYTPEKASTIANALGKADYSYFFVMQYFVPVLRRFGEVTVASDLTTAVAQLRARGDAPVALLFMPPHKMPLEIPCPAIPVFAWEYTDLPTDAWSSEVRNDWRRVLRQAGGGITHSSFAVQAIRRAMGQDFAVGSLPAPIWDRYSRLSQRKSEGAVQQPWTLTFEGALLDSRDLAIEADGKPRAPASAPAPQSVTLSGVVYTAVLNPLDGRKNWGDLLTAFVWALGEETDATLLIKLVHSDLVQGCGPIQDRLVDLAPHRCRIVVIQGYLPEAGYEAMIASTSYAVNCATGEGQCLPLMEFMSAGTPAIAPDHTAMEEYVSPANSFVLRSSDEWTQWPHDGRGVLRCFTRRVDWDSLRRAFVESWAVATQDPARYRTMGRAATRALRAYCSEETVSQSLGRFLASWSGEDEAPSLQRSDAAPARSALTTVLEPLRSLADLIRARRRA
jgi:glycosyltransferase involved in cell wall biosynthesis